MWLSERQKRKALIKKELDHLKKEILEEDVESLFKSVNFSYQKKDGLNVEIPFLDETICLNIPSFTFTKRSGGNLDTQLKVILLKYLKAMKLLHRNEDESFVSLKDLNISGNVTKSLEKAFAYDARSLMTCALAIGGKTASSRDKSITFSVLPGVKFLFVFSEAEEQKNAELEVFVPKRCLNVFFHRDLIYLTRTLIRKILKEAKRTLSEDSF